MASIETDVPDYAADPDGDGHAARRAHPAGQPSHARDRGEPDPAARASASRAASTAPADSTRGWRSCATSAASSGGFLAVQARLAGEPLEEYILPEGGGFFFALPGVPTPDGYLGERLVAP